MDTPRDVTNNDVSDMSSEDEEVFSYMNGKTDSDEVGREPPNFDKSEGGNCVWSSFLGEEQVTNDVNAVCMAELPRKSKSRHCEAYNYLTKRAVSPDTSDEIIDSIIDQDDEDDLFRCDSPVPDLDDQNSFERIKGKRKAYTGSEMRAKYPKTDVGERRSVKDRLGNFKTYDDQLADCDLMKNVGMYTIDELTNLICGRLNEPKKGLIKRVIETIGRDKTVILLGMTQDVQDSGGALTKNEKRKKSSGGVFLTFVKSDKTISQKKLRYIFSEEKKLYNLNRKRQKKYHRKKKSKNNKKTKLTEPAKNPDKEYDGDEDMEPGEIKD